MYQVFVEGHFDAAHYIRNYHGKCENLHGHRFKVVVHVEATSLDEIGLAYDFAQLKRQLREIIAPFDHTCLNDVPPFNRLEPSCENLATTIYGELQPLFHKSSVKLACVEVWESPTSGVAYYS